MLEKKHRVYETKSTKTVGMFAGILRCSDCGRPLAYMSKTLKDCTKGVYRCSGYNNNGGKSCTPHYIDEADVTTFVLNDIRHYAVLSAKERERLEKRLVSYMRKTQSADTQVLQSSIKKDENRLAFIASTIKSLYEDKVSGELPKERFLTFLKEYEQEQAQIEETLPSLRRELAAINETTGDIDEWLSLIESSANIETLDRTTVKGLVERITVGERVRKYGKSEQSIEICYRFIGRLLAGDTDTCVGNIEESVAV